MKKAIIFLFIIFLFSLITIKKDHTIIPKNSIRFRIIANSNSIEDQAIKWKVNEKLLPILNEIDNTSYNESKISLKSNLKRIEKEINSLNVNYKINLGNNYFPEKEYDNITYPEGYYDSLVITLGEGKGDNWWCVLFPPLCLIETKENEIDKVTYSSYIKTIINKYS